MGRTRVFEADVSAIVSRAYSPLLKAQGLSGRAETRISRIVREALRRALLDTVVDAFRDGSAPYRTGRARNTMLGGVRVFGTRFANLRGHIIGPEYIAAHERGSTIRPKNARALAIPLPAALRPDGSPKLPGPRSWANIQRTFIYKSRRTGRAYIAMKVGRSMTLLYMLVSSVTLKEHAGFLSRAWLKNTPAIIEAFAQALFFEMGQVNLLSLSRISTGGRGRRRR